MGNKGAVSPVFLHGKPIRCFDWEAGRHTVGSVLERVCVHLGVSVCQTNPHPPTNKCPVCPCGRLPELRSQDSLMWRLQTNPSTWGSTEEWQTLRRRKIKIDEIKSARIKRWTEEFSLVDACVWNLLRHQHDHSEAHYRPSDTQTGSLQTLPASEEAVNSTVTRSSLIIILR